MWSQFVSIYKCAILPATALYVCCLTLMLVQKNEGEAFAKLRYVDPSLGKPIHFADLATECGINNIKVVLFDIHVFSHVMGWFLATVALRDVALSWVSGFIWEIVEGSLEHSIPELRECWWDKEFNWAQVSTPDGSALHQNGFFYFIPGRNTFQQNYYGLWKNAKTLAVWVYLISEETDLENVHLRTE